MANFSLFSTTGTSWFPTTGTSWFPTTGTNTPFPVSPEQEARWKREKERWEKEQRDYERRAELRKKWNELDIEKGGDYLRGMLDYGEDPEPEYKSRDERILEELRKFMENDGGADGQKNV